MTLECVLNGTLHNLTIHFFFFHTGMVKPESSTGKGGGKENDNTDF